MEPKRGKKVAAATKNKIIKNIWRKGFWETREPKVFKTGDLFKVTVREIINLPVFSQGKRPATQFERYFIFLRR